MQKHLEQVYSDVRDFKYDRDDFSIEDLDDLDRHMILAFESYETLAETVKYFEEHVKPINKNSMHMVAVGRTTKFLPALFNTAVIYPGAWVLLIFFTDDTPLVDLKMLEKCVRVGLIVKEEFSPKQYKTVLKSLMGRLKVIGNVKIKVKNPDSKERSTCKDSVLETKSASWFLCSNYEELSKMKEKLFKQLPNILVNSGDSVKLRQILLKSS